MLHSILNKCSTTYDHYYGRHRCDPRGGCICDATASRVPRKRAPADPCVANTRTKRQRKGRLSIERDGKKCTGVLSKDNLSGQGSIEYPSGDRYLNTFPVALILANGELIFISNRYDGRIVHGLPEGKGKMTRARGGGIWSGDFN